MSYVIAVVVVLALYVMAWKVGPHIVHDDDLDLLEHCILTFCVLAVAAFVLILTLSAVAGLAFLISGGHP